MAGTTAYKNQWQKENQDRVNLVLPKGKKEIIQAAAEAQGETVNGYIKKAIDQRLERDNAAPAATEGVTE